MCGIYAIKRLRTIIIVSFNKTSLTNQLKQKLNFNEVGNMNLRSCTHDKLTCKNNFINSQITTKFINMTIFLEMVRHNVGQIWGETG